MRFLFLADTQIGWKALDYMRYLERSLDFFLDVVKRERPDVVVHLGDVLEDQGTVEVRDVVWASSFFRRLRQTLSEIHQSPARRIWIVRGNHDMADRKGEVSSVEIFDEYPFTFVFSEPAYVDFPSGEGRIAVIPYVSPEGVSEFLEGAPSDLRVLFSHTEWTGVRHTPQHVSEVGLDPREIGVPIFAGHYHAPHDEETFHVVGSPLYRDFRDVVTEESRGFLLWDTVSEDVLRIPNPHTSHLRRIVCATREELLSSHAELLPLLANLRIQVDVPDALIEEAEETFGDALWVSVRGRKESIEEGASSSVHLASSPAEILEEGISLIDADLSSGDLDKDVVRSTGKIVLGL
jgi:predicted phosphodiesterase